MPAPSRIKNIWLLPREMSEVALELIGAVLQAIRVNERWIFMKTAYFTQELK
jgi:hypothetical protein